MITPTTSTQTLSEPQGGQNQTSTHNTGQCTKATAPKFSGYKFRVIRRSGLKLWLSRIPTPSYEEVDPALTKKRLSRKRTYSRLDNPAKKASSANIIKKAWRNCRDHHMQKMQSIQSLATTLGKKATSYKEILSSYEEGDIIVQISLDDDPLLGHSAFYLANETVLSLFFVGKTKVDSYEDDESRKQCCSKYSLKKEDYKHRETLNQKFNKEEYLYSWIGITEAGNHGITCEGRTRRLLAKGCFFIIKHRHTKELKNAMDLERERFVKLPYSYGIQYNCHTYIYNCLKRVIDQNEIKERKAILTAIEP